MDRERLGAVLLFVLVSTLAAGCSSTSQGEKMVQSYARTRETLAGSQSQVDMALIAMDSMRRTPAERLKDAFGRYKDAVTQLEKEGASALCLYENAFYGTVQVSDVPRRPFCRKCMKEDAP